MESLVIEARKTSVDLRQEFMRCDDAYAGHFVFVNLLMLLLFYLCPTRTLQCMKWSYLGCTCVCVCEHMPTYMGVFGKFKV